MTDDKWLLEPANAKPMTVQQRAWELISFFKRYGAHFENDIESAKFVIEVIHQACDQARAEGLKQGAIDAALSCTAHKDGYAQGCADTIHNSPMYEAGFSDCREQAAKLMEPKKILRENGKEVQVGLGLASEIRALTPGEGAKACRCACHSIPERYAHLDGKCLGCHKPGEVAK